MGGRKAEQRQLRPQARCWAGLSGAQSEILCSQNSLRGPGTRGHPLDNGPESPWAHQVARSGMIIWNLVLTPELPKPGHSLHRA